MAYSCIPFEAKSQSILFILIYKLIIQPHKKIIKNTLLTQEMPLNLTQIY
jgi:hypothetical protein